MSDETSLLHSITRSKLCESVNNKDHCSLHRWVLLKNSITSSSTLPMSQYPETTPNNIEDPEEEEEQEEELGSIVVDTFMFPDAGNFLSSHSTDVYDSEAQWLDSLLETLAEDEDDDYPSDSEIHISVLPVDEDDDHLLSPAFSPLSSSDDLHQSHFYSSPVSVPYASRLTSFDSSLAHGYPIATAPTVSASSFSSPFEDALPYRDIDDIEESSVPDAIEDVSDDESDALSTPSSGRSITSLSLDSSASPSSPTEHSRLRHSLPHAINNKNTHYLNPFELDPLPFAEEPFHHAFHSAY